MQTFGHQFRQQLRVYTIIRFERLLTDGIDLNSISNRRYKESAGKVSEESYKMADISAIKPHKWDILVSGSYQRFYVSRGVHDRSLVL